MLIASCRVAGFEEVIFPLILSGNPRTYLSIFFFSVGTNSCRTHQGQLMETIVVCLNFVSFQSQSPELLLYPLDLSCWAVFRSHHRLESSPWNMVSIDEP
ncbi:hypothetical protein Tco_0082761 [Tanacetum coccineum]